MPIILFKKHGLWFAMNKVCVNGNGDNDVPSFAAFSIDHDPIRTLKSDT